MLATNSFCSSGLFLLCNSRAGVNVLLRLKNNINTREQQSSWGFWCRELPPLPFSPAAAPECSTRCKRRSPPAWQAAPLLAQPLRLPEQPCSQERHMQCVGSCQVRIPARKGTAGDSISCLAGPCSTLTFYLAVWHDPQKGLCSYFLQHCFNQQLVIFVMNLLNKSTIIPQ